MSRKILSVLALFALLAISLAPVAAQFEDVAVDDQPDRFSWDSYHAFADEYDFSGMELEIFGPWIENRPDPRRSCNRPV